MKVDNCLGCCSLKIGVVIIGILQVIFCSIIIIYVTVLLSAWTSFGEDNKLQNDKDLFLKIFVIIFLGVSALQLLITGLLIYGAVKERRGFLMPWLVLSAISLCISTLNTLLLICQGKPQSIVGLVALGIGIYMWIVVHSFYKSLRSDGYKDQTAAFVINSEKV